MRVADDGKSIDMTIDEALKMMAIGFRIVCNDGRVDAVVEEGKTGGTEYDEEN